MAPSPLCSNLVTFVSFISKTRIKIHNFHKTTEAGTNVALPLCADGKTKAFLDFIGKATIKVNIFWQFACAPLGCFTYALMFARVYMGIGFTETLVDFMGKARIKVGSRLVSLLFVSLPPCCFTVARLLPTELARACVLELARCAVRNRRKTFRE